MVQWFPGHMAKARREVEESLKKVDMVIELLDARLPLSSRNPMIGEITRHKRRLVLLNKADLADESVTAEWKRYLEQEHPVLPINATEGQWVNRMVEACQRLMADKWEAKRKRGIQPPPIRAMILGIPNVGKSTVINRLATRKAAHTGDRPGVTQRQQWIRVRHHMQLLDTPGILWPKFEDPQVGFRLAASGAIRDEVLDVEEIGLMLLNYLKRRYPKALAERYKLQEPAEDDLQNLEHIGRMRGCLRPGNEVDTEKAAEVLLRDLRTGRLGGISLEWPEDYDTA